MVLFVVAVVILLYEYKVFDKVCTPVGDTPVDSARI